MADRTSADVAERFARWRAIEVQTPDALPPTVLGVLGRALEAVERHTGRPVAPRSALFTAPRDLALAAYRGGRRG